jgi:peptidoglycan hydrolase FlgJ
MQGSDLRGYGSTQAVGPETYTDYKGLQSQPTSDSPEALKKAAKQFESVFLHMWLKSMREANAGFGEGSYLNSPAMESHQQMLDGEMAVSLSNSGGIGLAEVIERQLSGLSAPVRRDVEINPVSESRSAERGTGPGGTMPSPAIAGGKAAGGQDDNDRRGFLLQLSSALEGALEGTALPKLGVLAQAVLETGWGKRVIKTEQGNSSFNLFGIKATGWNGDAVNTATREFQGGRFLEKTEAFRVYDSLQSAVGDYVEVLRGSSRYDQVFSSAQEFTGDALQQVRKFADSLQKGGYATDPGYADKIVAVARSIISLTGGQ